MILYKAIKYIILEVCLESIYNGVIKNFSKSKLTRLTDLPKMKSIASIEYNGYIFKECEAFDINVQTGSVVTALWALYRNGELYKDFVCMERIGEDDIKYVTVIEP